MSLASALLTMFRRKPGYSTPDQPIEAVPATLPPGTVGQPYPAFQLRHRGGSGGAVRWEFTGDSLGVGIDATGLTGGSPTAAGTSTTVGVVVDVATGTRSQPVAYPFTVSMALAVVQTPAANGAAGAAWSYQFTSTGGRQGTVIWTAATVVPAEASWNAATGTLSYASAPAGSIAFAAFARDADGRQTTPWAIAASISPDLVITTAALGAMAVGVTYAGPGLTWAGNDGTVTATMSGHPDGLTINSSTGALGGAPTVGGTFDITLTATDSSESESRTFTVLVTNDSAAITTTTLGFATVGAPFDVQLEATTTDYPDEDGEWTLPDGSLPAGVSLLSTGRVYGTPLAMPVGTTTQVFTPTIRYTSAHGPVAEKTFTLRLANPVVVTQPPNQSWTTGEAVSLQLVASGGYGTITFTHTVGLAIPGVPLGSTGLYTGTTQGEGTYGHIVQAADSEGRVDTEACYFFIDSPITLTSDDWPDMTVGDLFTSPTPVVTGADGAVTWEFVANPLGATRNASTGVVTYTPVSGDAGTIGTTTLRCTDSDGSFADISFVHRVNAAVSAPVVSLKAVPVGFVGQAYSFILEATGGNVSGNPPYENWQISGTLPTGWSIRDRGDGSGEIYGTCNSVTAPAGVNVTVDDSAGTTSAARNFVFEVRTAPSSGVDDRDFLHSLSGIVQERYFDSSDDVHRYAWRNTLYTGDPAILTDRDPARLQWVGPDHPDAALIPEGLTGIAKIAYPTTAGDNAINMVMFLNESWNDEPDPNVKFRQGYGSGDEYWFAIDFLVTDSWVNEDSGAGGGPKLFILNRIGAHNTANEGQEYCNNFAYRGILQGGADGGNNAYVGHMGRWETSMSISGTSRIVYQPAIDHQANPGRHPAGSPPPTPGTAEYDNWRYGGIYNFPGYGYTEPNGGAVQFTRDMVGKWCRFIGHRKYGSPMWGNNNSVKEDWICLPGQDALPLFRTDQRRYDLATETISGFNNTAYGRSFAIDGPGCPEGGHPINMMWLLFQDTGRTGSATPETPRTIYFSRFIVREGPLGIPAPGFAVPPASYYAKGPEPPTGGVTILSTTSPGYATVAAAAPSGWTAGGSINVEVVTPYSEAAYDYVRNRLMVHGGGHTDSACNAMFAYDLGPNTSPLGFSVLDFSATGSVQGATSGNGYTYSDGRPPSTHTYRASYIANDGHYGKVSGSMHSSGFAYPYLAEFDPAAGTWRRWSLPSGINTYLGAYAVYDWQRDLVIVIQPGNGNYTVFDRATRAFSSVTQVRTSSGQGWTFAQNGQDGCTCELVTVGADMYVVAYGNMSTAERQSMFLWNGSTLGPRIVLTASGDSNCHTASGPGSAWDREDNVLWGWLPTSGNDPDVIYKGTVTVGNIAWVAHTRSMSWTGSTPNRGYHKIFPVTGKNSLLLIRNHDAPLRLVDKP